MKGTKEGAFLPTNSYFKTHADIIKETICLFRHDQI